MKKYNDVLETNSTWLKETFDKIDKKMSVMTLRSRNKLPYGVDENGMHIDTYPKKKDWWTNGFWGATNLLMYSKTGNEEYLATACRSEELLDEVLEDYTKLHHDVGFMWHILSGAKYRLTGDLKSKNRNLYMASVLSSRFVLCGQDGFIRAWNGGMGGGTNYNWSIVDCLMNLSLLYWASEEIGDDRFKRIAMKHADMALEQHLREDGSVVHIVEHERETGSCVKTHGGQGYGVGSSWSRGCAWALYGFMISHKYTQEVRYLEGARKVADHFIEACAKTQWLPVIDFYAPKEPVYYDSTAGACAACGLIELAEQLPEEEGAKYLQAAIHILRAMADKFCDFTIENDILLGYGSERYPVDGDLKKAGVHMPIIYGDFFYIEAVLKLLGNEFTPW